MKKIYLSLIALVCIILQTGCTCDAVPTEPSATGNGTFALSVNADDIQTDVVTRSTDVDVNAFKVTLKDKDNITLIDQKVFGSLSPTDRTLPAGEGYKISAESCTAVESTTANEGWGSIRFAGETPFNIVSDETTEVTIDCNMANTGFQVIFDESFTSKFPQYSATTQDGRALVFKSSTTEKTAFYNVDENGNAPKISLRLIGSKGGFDDRIDYTKEDINLTAGKITKYTIKYDENSGDLKIEFETNTGTNTEDNDVTVQ